MSEMSGQESLEKLFPKLTKNGKNRDIEMLTGFLAVFSLACFLFFFHSPFRSVVVLDGLFAIAIAFMIWQTGSRTCLVVLSTAGARFYTYVPKHRQALEFLLDHDEFAFLVNLRFGWITQVCNQPWYKKTLRVSPISAWKRVRLGASPNRVCVHLHNGSRFSGLLGDMAVMQFEQRPNGIDPHFSDPGELYGLLNDARTRRLSNLNEAATWHCRNLADIVQWVDRAARFKNSIEAQTIKLGALGRIKVRLAFDSVLMYEPPPAVKQQLFKSLGVADMDGFRQMIREQERLLESLHARDRKRHPKSA